MARTEYFRWSSGGTLYAKERPLDTGTWSNGIVTGAENGTTGEFSFALTGVGYELFLQAAGSPASTDTAVGYFDAVDSSYNPFG